jgi:hypothetical protein
MNTGVFVSASVYYTASSYSNFYRDYTNYLSINGGKNQGIVYTSDMSLSSCYTMQATSASSATLTTDIITELSISIFEASTNTFINDTDAY